MVRKLCSILAFMVLASFVYAEELSITTYYPSPYGNYREMRAKRMAIGDSYINGASYCWEGTCSNSIGSSASLVVERRVGIGELKPDEMLHVVGKVKIVDGTQGEGKVLTSNANGVASWQDPPNGGANFLVTDIPVNGQPINITPHNGVVRVTFYLCGYQPGDRTGHSTGWKFEVRRTASGPWTTVNQWSGSKVNYQIFPCPVFVYQFTATGTFSVRMYATGFLDIPIRRVMIEKL